MEWQPIETAPRDGTKVIVWISGKDASSGYATRAWWTNRVVFTFGKEVYKTDELTIEGDALFGALFRSGEGQKPSHWLSFPDPPEPPQ